MSKKNSTVFCLLSFQKIIGIPQDPLYPSLNTAYAGYDKQQDYAIMTSEDFAMNPPDPETVTDVKVLAEFNYDQLQSLLRDAALLTVDHFMDMVEESERVSKN